MTWREKEDRRRELTRQIVALERVPFHEPYGGKDPRFQHLTVEGAKQALMDEYIELMDIVPDA